MRPSVTAGRISVAKLSHEAGMIPKHVLAAAGEREDVDAGPLRQLEAEEPLHEDAEHEDGDAPDDERRGGQGGVPEGVLAQGRVDAEGDAQHLDEHGGERELDRVGGVLPDHLGDVLLQVEGLTEVALQHAADPDAVLHVDGLVEALLLADRLDLLFGRVLAGEHAGRVARDHVEHDERDHAHAEEHDDELDQTSDDIGQHDATLPHPSWARTRGPNAPKNLHPSR